MWLARIEDKLKNGEYVHLHPSSRQQGRAARGCLHTAASWERLWADVALIATNCRKYNCRDDPTSQWLRWCADQLEAYGVAVRHAVWADQPVPDTGGYNAPWAQ